jgi:hypothetical protein
MLACLSRIKEMADFGRGRGGEVQRLNLGRASAPCSWTRWSSGGRGRGRQGGLIDWFGAV